MRFLVVHPFSGETINTFPQLALLAQLAAESGWQCILLVPKGSSISLDIPDVILKNNGTSENKWRFIRLQRVFEWILTIIRIVSMRPDVVLACHASIVDGTIASRILKILGHKCRVVAYFMDYNEPHQGWWIRWITKNAKDLDALIDVDPLRLNYRKKWMHCPENSFAIYHAPRLSFGSHNLHQDPDQLRLILTGSLRPEIHPFELAKALATCPKNNIEIVWRMPGSDDEREDLKKILKQHGADIVKLLPSIPKAELLNELSSYHLGMIWNPVEGQDPMFQIQYETCASNKLGEFLSAGLGVIYTGNRGLLFLDDAGAGLAVDPNEPESLGRLLSSLLANLNKVRAMQLAARTLFDKTYNLDSQARPFMDWLNRLG